MAKKVQVMQLKNGQMLATLPKAMCEAYNLKKGDIINFEYLHRTGKISGLILSKEE